MTHLCAGERSPAVKALVNNVDEHCNEEDWLLFIEAGITPPAGAQLGTGVDY